MARADRESHLEYCPESAGDRTNYKGDRIKMALLKRIAATFPRWWQYELKHFYYGLQIRLKQFFTYEPEYSLLSTLLLPGDCVIDVGANVGHYTKRFSELVGKNGRVIAFEPVPEIFALLTGNVQLFSFSNVTLINAALSDEAALVGMSTPTAYNGLKNFYRAHIVLDTDKQTDVFQVMTLRLDSLNIPQKVSLVKIDVEGHEAFVLRGMADILHRDHPTLIVETDSPEVEANLCSIGYMAKRLDGSPNILFRHKSYLMLLADRGAGSEQRIGQV
jgi:FkbM family methyltransferase